MKIKVTQRQGGLNPSKGEIIYEGYVAASSPEEAAEDFFQNDPDIWKNANKNDYDNFYEVTYEDVYFIFERVGENIKAKKVLDAIRKSGIDLTISQAQRIRLAVVDA